MAYSYTKYTDLSYNRINAFSFDKTMEHRVNTAVYIMYAYIRICLISRNSGEDSSN